MKKWLLRLLYAALVLLPVGAIADYNATQGAGSAVFAFVCSTTKICPAMVLIDSSNVEKATAGNPLRTDPVGTTTQPVNPATIGNWGLAASTQNVPTSTNGMLAMGEFNTTPTTITSGNSSPLQLDSAGKLIVNCATGCAGGGAITAATGAFASGSIASGAMVDLGAIADATAAVGGAGTLSAKLRLMTSQLDSINTNIAGPTPAGTAIIGKVGIDPTANTVSSADYTTMPPGTSSPLDVPVQGSYGGVPLRLYDKGNAPTGSGTNSCAASCNGTALITGDFSDFAEISVQVTAVGVGGTLTFQESNDNFAATANTAQCAQRSSSGSTSPIVTTQTAVGIVTCKIGARYFRAQFSSYTSGTYTAFWAAGKATGTSNVQPVFVTALPDLGAIADAAASVGSTGSLSAKLRLMTTQLDNINTNVTQSIPAGTNVIGHVIADTGSTTAVTALPAIPAGTNLMGKVGIDQTTPGTTNGVQVNAALPAGTNLMGKVGIDQTTPGVTNGVNQTDGTNTALVDPCQSGAKVYTPVNVVTATNIVITGVAAKKKYICGMFLYPGGTDNIAIYQATTATSCATAAVGVIGGATTATGIIATAQAGFVLPTTGYAHAATTVNQTDLCITTSAAVQLSGVVVTVDR